MLDKDIIIGGVLLAAIMVVIFVIIYEMKKCPPCAKSVKTTCPASPSCPVAPPCPVCPKQTPMPQTVLEALDAKYSPINRNGVVVTAKDQYDYGRYVLSDCLSSGTCDDPVSTVTDTTSLTYQLLNNNSSNSNWNLPDGASNATADYRYNVGNNGKWTFGPKHSQCINQPKSLMCPNN